MVYEIILSNESGKKTGYKYIQVLTDGTKKEYFATYKVKQPVFNDLVQEIDSDAKLEIKRYKDELTRVELKATKLAQRKL
jgi:hypothetical protein